MTKANKILEYGLEGDARALLDSGHSVYETADILTQKLDEGKSVSHMSVQRLKDKWRKDKMLEEIESGRNPGEVILSDFKDGVRETIKKSQVINTTKT